MTTEIYFRKPNEAYRVLVELRGHYRFVQDYERLSQVKIRNKRHVLIPDDARPRLEDIAASIGATYSINGRD